MANHEWYNFNVLSYCLQVQIYQRARVLQHNVMNITTGYSRKNLSPQPMTASYSLQDRLMDDWQVDSGESAFCCWQPLPIPVVFNPDFVGQTSRMNPALSRDELQYHWQCDTVPYAANKKH